MEDKPYSVVRILHEDSVFPDNSILFHTIPVIFFLLGGISNSSQDSSSKIHQKAPQSTHKIQNFQTPLEMVSPRAHQVPWLVSTSRYAPEVRSVHACSYRLVSQVLRSQLTYCSQLWRPHLIKDITLLERIQRRATKYILNDYELSYKSRLEQLHLLPLMYIYELNDLLFLIKSLKFPTSHFDISKYIQFSNYGTRATFAHKLNHPTRLISNTHQHSFHNRIITLWNSAPVTINRHN